MRVVVSGSDLHDSYTAGLCRQEAGRRQVVRFLQQLDIDFADIEVREEDFEFEDWPQSVPIEVQKFISSTLAEKKLLHTYFSHRMVDSDDVAIFPIEMESAGTRILFALAGPWLNVLQEGMVLVFDELNNSLHPHAVRSLVRLFYNNEINAKGGQIIFTSHDPWIMSDDFVTRDQVWLLEKESDKATRLYALAEFKPRIQEALMKGYHSGRYGAIPRIKNALLGAVPGSEKLPG